MEQTSKHARSRRHSHARHTSTTKATNLGHKTRVNHPKIVRSFTRGTQTHASSILQNKKLIRIAAIVLAVVVVVGIVSAIRSCTSAPTKTAEDQNTAPEEVVEDTSLDDVIVTTTTPEGITFTGPASFPDSETYATLVDAINTFEAEGYSLGFSLIDVETGAAVSYNPDQTFYSASTIKAPYVMALYESNEHSMNYLGSSETVRNCLVYSDNEAYSSLRMSYDSSFMYDWLIAAGFSEADAQALYNEWYVFISANQLAAMWLHGYDYLISGSANALQLQEYLSASEHSCIHALTTGTYTAWTKPGWYPSGGYEATNDAGVVQADSGTYVVAVMSNAPSDFAALVPVVDAVNMAHGELTGGSTDSLITAETQIPSDS